MRRSKKALFYGIMAVMTLAVIEVMAQAAYLIAYGEFNGGGPAALLPEPAATDDAEDDIRNNWVILHPYYGYTRTDPGYLLNRLPLRREDGVVLIALVGGSVGRYVAAALQSALEAWFRDNDIPLRPVTLELASNGMKQPQQMIQIANTLALGGEYDIIVNLDGHNELIVSQDNYFQYDVFPFFPLWWQELVTLTAADKLLVGQIALERERQERLLAAARVRPWRWSALYGIISRYRLERSERRLLTLNHELAVTASGEYSLERQGPQWDFQDEYELRRMALRVWYRGSVMLADLSRTSGAEYYHFLQPNQYVPDSKPLTDAELAVAYDPENRAIGIYRDAYPQLQRLGDELRQQGINYHDLTQIFADSRETLYKNDCCHLNARGNELLAASMVRRLEPALRKRGALAAAAVAEDTMAAGTALDAAEQDTSPIHAVNKLYFDVSYTAEGTLRYSRDDCRAADTAAPFFMQITPLDAADLLPAGAVAGYNSDDFTFSRYGEITDAAGRCVMEYELPDYDIASIRTGQYSLNTGEALWRVNLTLDLAFEVERTAAGVLRYYRDNCLPIHLAPDFFLHITPADAADLHPETAEYGINNWDFSGFNSDDGIIDADGRCVIERELPDYDIASIHTGQYSNAAGRLWETRIDFEQP